MNLFRPLSNLRIRYKLLVSYSAVFILAITLGSIIIYSLVKKTIEVNIESELKNSTTTILNMVKTSAAVSIKNHLRAVAEKNREIAEHFYRLYSQGVLSEEDAKSQATVVLLSQTIAKTGYIYCVDSNGVAVIHPKKAVIGVNFSDRAFVREQKLRKEGYLEYDWKNPGETYTRPKALYMTYFAPWDWIISVSSYREEFNELVNVDDFRKSILSLRFGKTGYSYVIDSKGNLVIHPKLQGEKLLNANDVKGRQFVREMVERKSGKIIYSWANPGETIPREKLVIFNYIPEFDWIVASSCYLEEFYAPLHTIQNIIIATVFASLLLVLPITFRISSSITNPLQELMNRFTSEDTGDFTARMERKSQDEVGQLAMYFNTFMKRLEVYSTNLQEEILERKRAEDSLRESEEKLAGILRSVTDIMITVDENYHIIWANDVARKFFGPDLVGKKCYIALHNRHEACEPCIAKKCFEKNKSYEIETRLTGIKGNKIDVWCTASVAARYEDGRPKMVLEVFRNITEKKALEAEAMRAGHLASLGELAAGVAHEINNPINGIINYAQILIDQCEEQEEDTEIPKRIIKEGERIANIVKNLLSFARDRKEEHSPTLIQDIIADSLSLVNRQISNDGIKLKVNVPADLPKIKARSQQIQQVFLNILSNARYALKRKFPEPHQDKLLEINAEMIEIGGDKMVRTKFHDRGIGMPPDILDKICEPFFSTKPRGEGTGLGLSISYGIIKDHGGTLRFDSEEGKYTNVIVDLPVDNAWKLKNIEVPEV